MEHLSILFVSGSSEEYLDLSQTMQRAKAKILSYDDQGPFSQGLGGVVVFGLQLMKRNRTLQTIKAE
ncbi:hypothetical protein HNY73_018762 [Argiope bruennichi]|uniref:Uncharacterized protein n=1 Tax=Argiope bruennichi TaxID=94029 RepID=A0A8T0EHC7_ARGBR|nr:hypothetical protein HNY73_018762 [Argiope bruennichi]